MRPNLKSIRIRTPKLTLNEKLKIDRVLRTLATGGK